MAKKNILPTEKDIENYKLLKLMLESQRIEFNKLSSKKPTEQLNKTKIKMVNRVLEPLKELFKNEDSFQFLDILSEDDMPINSDVVLIISQYETAIEEFKNKYYLLDRSNRDSYGDSKFRWNVKENPIKNISEK